MVNGNRYMVWNGKTNWGGGGFETRLWNEEEKERRGATLYFPTSQKFFSGKLSTLKVWH